MLHDILVGITPKVYFQPPPNDKIEYPCIVYSRDDSDVKHAGNNPYSFTWRYQVTLIDRDPDSPVLDKLAALPLCDFNRSFKANNLNHDVFTLYF
jgi:hypothetical protein